MNLSEGPLSRLTRWKVNFTINSTLLSPFYPLQSSPHVWERETTALGGVHLPFLWIARRVFSRYCERQKEYYKLQKELPEICKVNTQRNFGFIVTNWKEEVKSHVWCMVSGVGKGGQPWAGVSRTPPQKTSRRRLTLIRKNICHGGLCKSVCPNFTQFLSPNGYI